MEDEASPVSAQPCPSKIWDPAAGDLCNGCGVQRLRFTVRDNRVLCIQCARNHDRREELAEQKRARQTRFIKAHNARVAATKKKRDP